MTTRPYFNSGIAELERIVRDPDVESAKLTSVLHELGHRDTDRSARLKAEIRARLEGALPQLPQQAQDTSPHPGEFSSNRPIQLPLDQTETAGSLGGAHTLHVEPEPASASGSSVARADNQTEGAAPVEFMQTVIDNDGGDEEVSELGPHVRAGVDIPFAASPAEDSTVPLEVARARQVFRFLRDFSERNVPVVRTLERQLWKFALSSLPQHPSVQLGKVNGSSESETESSSASTPDEGDALLRVRRPRLTEPPPAPGAHAAWVAHSSDDPRTPPLVHDVRKRARRPEEMSGDDVLNAQPVVERRTDDSARVASLQGWLETWEAWAETERPARAAMAVFEQLYALLGRIERESERVGLMLGDGRLRRVTGAGLVDHPVLLQRVELTFNPSTLEFRVVDADRAPELYGAVLQGDHGIAGDHLHKLHQELELTGFHPLGDDSRGFLRKIAGMLGHNARFLEADETETRADVPTVRRDPALFLRVRSSGLPAALEKVLEDLENADAAPTGIARVVGVDADTTASDEDSSSSGLHAGLDSQIVEIMTSVGEPPDILFAKHANLEQVQVARALAKHGAVLVQGPPGTGKSHTIANLVGHLVAEGKRVLVTSHTTKALRVLRNHVPEALRPLCVTLLDQDLEGRAQLEEAVRGIVDRVSRSDEHALAEEVKRLIALRRNLMIATAELHEKLRLARVAEYEPVLVGGEPISPVEAARIARNEHDRHEWLPGPVARGAPLPLSIEEIEKLYSTNEVLSREEEREFEASLPPRDKVMDAPTFSALISQTDSREPNAAARLWERTPAEADASRLDALIGALEAFSRDLTAMPAWQRSLVAAGHQNSSELDLWQKLRTQVADLVGAYSRTRDLLLDHHVERLDPADPDSAGAITEIRSHLSDGGSLGRLALLFKPRWRQALGGWRVNEAAPSRKEHFGAIAAWLDLHARRRTLNQRWERQAVPVGLPTLESIREPIEPALGDYASQFEAMLEWWGGRWGEIASLQAAAGFRWTAFRDAEVAKAPPRTPFESDVAIATGTLLEAVRARVGAVHRLRALRLLQEQSSVIAAHSGLLAIALRKALETRDVDAWTLARRELEVVGAKAEAFRARITLLANLSAGAPGWAEAIRSRSGVHGASRAPTNVAAAWRWRQIVEELERRSSVDERDVARELERRRTELRERTRELIDRKAWLAQLRRTDGNARRALIGWSDTQKRIGKGTGKRVPELQAEARKLLSQARDAVPVWIMPLTRVAESFDPRQRKFDVVIVDEASQSDVTGLLAFYLGKRVVVVGDHEQVSPSAVGQKQADVQHLIAQHLIGVPNAHLYDGLTSIYDLARQSFGGSLALREHFRCVPDIVEFSNQLSYSGQMRPLRDPSTAAQPHLAEYVVAPTAGLVVDNKVNEDEARVAAALFAAMAELPEYANKTFGCITLVGEEQALRIQTVLLSLLGADVLQRHCFAAGNAAQFQGDERDIMLLSMVDVPSATGRPLALRDTTMFKQRYNVAVSRAKDQLWLVHSLNPDRDLQPHDLRRRLIDHVRDPGAIRRAQSAATARAESPFEKAVIERLVAAGFHVTPQVDVGRYRIDMVISDGTRRVALECDGDRFHPPEQIPEDIARQAVLERSGWRFVRLRGTRFYRDPEGSMQWVFEELARLGVTSLGQPAQPTLVRDGGALQQAVVRVAWSIMQKRGWVPTADPLREAEALSGA